MSRGVTIYPRRDYVLSEYTSDGALETERLKHYQMVRDKPEQYGPAMPRTFEGLVRERERRVGRGVWRLSGGVEV